MAHAMIITSRKLYVFKSHNNFSAVYEYSGPQIKSCSKIKGDGRPIEMLEFKGFVTV
jgi:hypothetical protein